MQFRNCLADRKLLRIGQVIGRRVCRFCLSGRTGGTTRRRDECVDLHLDVAAIDGHVAGLPQTGLREYSVAVSAIRDRERDG